MSFIDIKKIIFRFSYIKQRGFTRAHNVLITRSRFRSNSFILSFIVSYLYITQRICKRTNFRWIIYNKISISNIFRYWWEWEFEESFRGIGNGSGKKCLMSIKKITFRFSYIKQKIDRGFTRAHNALIMRSRFHSNSFTLSFIVSCFTHPLYKECAKEQILDELCVMSQ